MVNEINMKGEVLHLKDITKPSEPELAAAQEKEKTAAKEAEDEKKEKSGLRIEDLPELLRFETNEKWPVSTTALLRDHFADETIVALHALFVEGKEAPPKSDSGWGSREKKPEEAVKPEEIKVEAESEEAAMAGGDGSGGGSG
jgi:tRNA pseudouridine13 synthase